MRHIILGISSCIAKDFLLVYVCERETNKQMDISYYILVYMINAMKLS